VPATTPAAVATACVTDSAAETTCSPAVCAASFTRSTTRRAAVGALRALVRAVAIVALAALPAEAIFFLAFPNAVRALPRIEVDLAADLPARLAVVFVPRLAEAFAPRLAEDFAPRAADRPPELFFTGFFPPLLLVDFAARFLAIGSFRCGFRLLFYRNLRPLREKSGEYQQRKNRGGMNARRRIRVFNLLFTTCLQLRLHAFALFCILF
jgi:hypothetical protein